MPQGGTNGRAWVKVASELYTGRCPDTRRVGAPSERRVDSGIRYVSITPCTPFQATMAFSTHPCAQVLRSVSWMGTS